MKAASLRTPERHTAASRLAIQADAFNCEFLAAVIRTGTQPIVIDMA